MTAHKPTPQGLSPPEPYHPPAARLRLDAEYDAIVHQIYRAAAGTQSWTVPLVQIAEASAARSVALGAIDKRTGAVIFSYSGGPAPVEATTEYIRTWYRIDPAWRCWRPSRSAPGWPARTISTTPGLPGIPSSRGFSFGTARALPMA